MSRQSGVSFVTMWKAVQRFRAKGKLSVVPGGGVFADVGSGGTVRSVPLALTESSAPRGRCRQVQLKLIDRIVRGYWRHGALPGTMELTRLLGCGYHTMTDTLAELVKEGWIAHGKGGYHVQAPAARQKLDVIVVICYVNHMPALTDFTPFSRTFLRSLQSECLRRGVTIEIRGYFNPSGGLRQRLYEDPRNGIGLGFLVYAPSFSAEVIREICTGLARKKAPAVIFDEASNPWLGKEGALPSCVRAVSLDGARSTGFDMGRHLLLKGHRSVAYFMHAADGPPWCMERLEGLRDAFACAGLRQGVRVFAALQHQTELESHINSNGPLKRIRKRLSTFQREFAPDYNGADSLFRHTLSAWLIRGRILMGVFLPSFERAAEDAAVSAWVGANDEVALLAGEYIFYTKDPRLKKVSTFGFDNRIETMDHVDGTYEFNVEAAVNIALECIINPKRVARSFGQFHEVEGSVVERPVRSRRTT
jgi:hypothetical protein